MQIQLKTANKLTYKLKLTPQVKLGINLLQMPLARLKEFIREQAEANPLLEAGNTGEGQDTGEENNDLDDEMKTYQESLIPVSFTFQEYLLRQLRLITDTDEDLAIGEFIIGNLDDNGYLRCSLEEIGGSLKITVTRAQEVLSLVQTLDPPGVGARDLRECLLLQLEAKGKQHSLPGQVIDSYLGCLEKKRYDHIAKKLGVGVEDIRKAVEEIARLDPKPGRSFSVEKTVRLIPDAEFKKNRKGYEVIFNDAELPRLGINETYRKMLKQKDIPEQTREYLKERLEAVQSLIYAVNRRKETIRQILQEIACVQKGFLDNGEPGFNPLTLEQIAKKIGKHKSTVSRAVSNKYVQTPRGIVELRYFLSPAVRQVNGALVSSKAIRSRIKGLIENETSPLADREISDRLKKGGISVSRRTVAKYRTSLKTPPSWSRTK